MGRSAALGARSGGGEWGYGAEGTDRKLEETVRMRRDGRDPRCEERGVEREKITEQKIRKNSINKVAKTLDVN